jgi:DNA cross-link repair 1C protein
MNGIKNAEFISALYRHKDSYLYCSEVTALILRNLGNQAIMNKVRTIKICSPTIISVPQIENEGCPQDVMVTLLPAGHCPGSTM